LLDIQIIQGRGMKLQHLLGKAEHVMGIPIHVKADVVELSFILIILYPLMCSKFFR